MTLPRTNYYGRRLRWWYSAFSKYTYRSRIAAGQFEAGGIGLNMNADKTEYESFTQKGDIFTRNGGSLKLIDKFTYLINRISSIENDINWCLAKTWTAIDKLLIVYKSDVSDRKTQFLPSSGCVNSTIWMNHMDGD